MGRLSARMLSPLAISDDPLPILQADLGCGGAASLCVVRRASASNTRCQAVENGSSRFCNICKLQGLLLLLVFSSVSTEAGLQIADAHPKLTGGAMQHTKERV